MDENQDKLLIGYDNRMVFVVNDPRVDETDESNLSESELIYRAVRNTINNIWGKYSDDETDSALLNTHEIKAFLMDFLRDQ